MYKIYVANSIYQPLKIFLCFNAQAHIIVLSKIFQHILFAIYTLNIEYVYILRMFMHLSFPKIDAVTLRLLRMLQIVKNHL